MNVHALAAVVPNAFVAVTLGTTAYLVMRPRATDIRNRALALFLGLVALNYLLIAVFQVVVATGWGDSAPFLVAALFVQAFDPAALVLFGSVYPSPSAAMRRFVRPVAFLAVAVAAASVAFPAHAVSDGSPLRILIEAYVTGTYVLVYAAFLVRQAHAPRSDRPAIPANLLLGFGILVVYRVFLVLAVPLTRGGQYGSPWVPPNLVVLYGWAIENALLLLVAVPAYALLRFVVEAPAQRRAVARHARVVLLVVALLSFVINAPPLLHDILHPEFAPTSPAASRPSVPGILGILAPLSNTIHFSSRWILFVALAGPAFLRNQVVNLDARLRRAAIVATGVAFFAAAGTFGAILIQETIREDAFIPVSTFVGLTLLVLLSTQAMRLARAFAARVFPDDAERDASFRRLRRLEAYREAIESHRAGRLSAPDLATLRTSLGISEGEDRAARALSGTDAAVVEAGTVLRDRYVLERPIGRGAHGRVFLAFDRRDSRRVAVKEVAADSLAATARIEREVTAARRLSHPRLVVPEDYFLEGRAAYLVSEYAPGGSLAERLATGPPVPLARAVAVAVDVLDGLATAHAAGIVHRDVKPANILIDEGGRARLCDFGVAFATEAAATEADIPEFKRPGTRSFLPPEALEGGRPDPRWDIYAMGLVLEEMLRGTKLEAYARGLTNIIARATAEDPRERYATAEEFSAELRSVVR